MLVLVAENEASLVVLFRLDVVEVTVGHDPGKKEKLGTFDTQKCMQVSTPGACRFEYA